jgi:hypothetical protein
VPLPAAAPTARLERSHLSSDAPARGALKAQATSQPGQLSDADVRDLAYDVQLPAAAVDEWAREASRLARGAKATAEHGLDKNLGTVDGSTWLQIGLNRLAQHLYRIIQQEAEPGTPMEPRRRRPTSPRD